MGKRLGDKLRKSRLDAEYTLQAAATIMGITHPAIQQWEKGKTIPEFKNLIAVAQLYNVPIGDLFAHMMADKDDLPARQQEATRYIGDQLRDMFRHAPTSLRNEEGRRLYYPTGKKPDQSFDELQSQNEVNRLNSDLAYSERDTPRDVPLLGVAVGGRDADFTLNGEAVDYLRRPVGLAHAVRVYAVYVVGSSMWPRYDEGDVLFINPDRPPLIGDDVIVEFKDSEAGDAGRCLLKRLMRRTSTALILQQFNPAAEFTIELEDVKHVHRVVPPRDLIGL